MAIGGVGFVLFALSLASQMDVERYRIAEILAVHGKLWRAAVENNRDQQDFVLTRDPAIADQIAMRRAAVDDYLAHLDSLLRVPEQRQQLEQLRVQMARWRASWDSKAASLEAIPPAELIAASAAEFEPINSLMAEFDRNERRRWNNAAEYLAERRELFFAIVAAFA